MNKRFFEYTIILLFGIYVLELASTGGLAFYIHPRYFLVTTIASVLCALVGFGGIIYELRLRDPKNEQKVDWRRLVEFASNKYFLSIFISGILILGFLFPPRSLSSRAASQRASSSNIVIAEANTAVSRFVSQRDKYGVAEWVSEISKQPDITKYVGETVNVDGFIYVPEGAPRNAFNVSRFVVRCCVVDATPLGLTVISEGWQDDFKSSDWVRVKGEFGILDVGEQQLLVIEPTEIIVEEVPDYPYVY